MANRFLNNITINDQYTLPSLDGTDGQVLSTTGAADGTTELVFVDQSTLSTGSSRTTTILVKNISAVDGGVSLSKGDPVYIYGSIGASERLYIDKADASNAAKMPCVGLLAQDLAPSGEGEAIVTGKLTNLVTSPIDGSTPSENDTIYVKSGGGLTLTKPTGASNRIQNIGQVGRVSTSSDGNIVVSAILRSNDVPNLNTGKIWVGSAANTTESGVVHLDEASGEMGINTNNPAAILHVTSSGSSAGSLLFQVDDLGDKYFQVLPDSSTTFLIGDLEALGSEVYIKGTYSNIQFHSDSGELVRIKSEGEVGIGTDNPASLLHIKENNTSTASGLTIEQSGTGDAIAHFLLSGVQRWVIGADNSDSDKFKIASSADLNTDARLTIDTSGNVGIGTTSPAAGYLLDVNGLGAFNTAVSVQGIDTGNPTAANEEIRLSGYGIMGSRTSFYITNANASGSIYFGIGGAHNANNKALINSSGISAPRYSDIDNSAFYLEPGSGATGQWKVQTPSGYVSIGPNNTSWAHFYTDRSNGYFFDKRIVVDSGTIASYNENLTLQAPYNTTRMTINSSNGNVGINNTSPSAKLHVGDSTDTTTVLKIEAGNTAGAPAATTELRMIGYESRGQGIFFQDSSNSNEEWFAGINYNSSWDKYSIGYDPSTNQAEYLTNAILTVVGSTGRVGVGTDSPGSELHVSGAIQNDEFTIPNTAGTSGQVLAWPATGTTLEWTTAGGGGGASELNDLSDCETTATSVYVGNAPASNSGETNNTVLGVNAGNSLTTGSRNTILGHFAAGSLTTYNDNVVIGYDAASQTGAVGANSVVIGNQACRNGGANSGQVAIGYQASRTDGATGGTAVGYQASYANDASYATNIGYQAGYYSGGSYGVTVGYRAGYYHSLSGTYNVSIGMQAGYNINTGDDNVSIGTRANDASNVSDTVVIGTDAGGNGASDGAIYIGRTAANKSGAYGSGADSIVIGHLAAASSSTAANEVTISPDQGTTNARFSASATAWTFSSDARLKENVEDLELGLDFIDQIQPRTFDWKKSGKKSSGFIAQELLEVVENNNADYTSIVNTDDAECYTVAQAALVPILVNAIKELKAEIDILKSKQ